MRYDARFTIGFMKQASKDFGIEVTVLEQYPMVTIYMRGSELGKRFFRDTITANRPAGMHPDNLVFKNDRWYNRLRRWLKREYNW